MTPEPLELIDQRLDAMLMHAPEYWGSAEAYELQVLLLLELRYGPHEQAFFMQGYSTFLQERRPEVGCRSLAAVESNVGVIAETLHEFRSELSAVAALSRPQRSKVVRTQRTDLIEHLMKIAPTGQKFEISYWKGKTIAAYLYLSTSGRKVARTEDTGRKVLIDYSDEGHPLGIEFLGPFPALLSTVDDLLKSLMVAAAD